MGREQRHFTDEFKREAVALLLSSDRPLVQRAECEVDAPPDIDLGRIFYPGPGGAFPNKRVAFRDRRRQVRMRSGAGYGPAKRNPWLSMARRRLNLQQICSQQPVDLFRKQLNSQKFNYQFQAPRPFLQGMDGSR